MQAGLSRREWMKVGEKSETMSHSIPRRPPVNVEPTHKCSNQYPGLNPEYTTMQSIDENGITRLPRRYYQVGTKIICRICVCRIHSRRIRFRRINLCRTTVSLKSYESHNTKMLLTICMTFQKTV